MILIQQLCSLIQKPGHWFFITDTPKLFIPPQMIPPTKKIPIAMNALLSRQSYSGCSFILSRENIKQKTRMENPPEHIWSGQ